MKQFLGPDYKAQEHDVMARASMASSETGRKKKRDYKSDMFMVFKPNAVDSDLL